MKNERAVELASRIGHFHIGSIGEIIEEIQYITEYRWYRVKFKNGEDFIPENWFDVIES